MIFLGASAAPGADTPASPPPASAAPASPVVPPPAPPEPITGKNYASKLIFRFDSPVFDSTKFPNASFEQDALVRQVLGPIQTDIVFYNAQFQEVKQADVPGRYGAVVHIKLGDGTELTRFITLYRAPKRVFWRKAQLDLSMDMPPEWGINPEIAREQKKQIGDLLKGVVEDATERRPGVPVLLAGLSEDKPGSPPELQRNDASARDALWWWSLKKMLGLTQTYPYLVQLPDGYDTDPAKRWPLIFFLHGSGERGDTLSKLNANGIPKLIAAGKKFPAVVISPQCPSNELWTVPELSQLLDEVSAKYRIDPDRMVVTGLSVGGYGTWALGLAYPDRFSAIVPICGGGDPLDAERLRHLPIWAFHGQKDPTVPVEMTLDMVAAIKKAGGHPHMTIYPDAGHNSWAQAYDTEALYTWMLAQKRGQPEVKTAGVPAP